MRFLLLSADISNPMPNVGDFFITHGIERLLEGHPTQRFPLHRKPTTLELESIAREYDALVICGSNIIGESGKLRTAWTVDDFKATRLPIIPLGLGSQADRGRMVDIDETGRELLSFWFQSSGPLSVRDALTYDTCEAILGKGSAVMTGCPSTMSPPAPTEMLRQHLLFCPPPFHYRADWMTDENWPGTLVRDFFQEVSNHRAALYLAQQTSDLLFDAAEPGWKTVHSPLYPLNHLELLGSAREIVSFRIHPCLVGVSMGTPAVLLSLDARTESLAEAYGIPFLRITPELQGTELWDLCRQVFEDYPWEKIRKQLEAHSHEMHAHVRQKGIDLTVASNIEIDGPTLSIACISDRKYFGQQLGLVENIKRVHQGTVKLHLLSLDEETERWANQHLFGIELHNYRLVDLWQGDDLIEIQKRSVAEIAYSSKAQLLKIALQKSEGPILFCDNDLFFFDSPFHLSEETPPEGALLFPHWNESTLENRWHGLFNSGLFAATRGALPFLEWWSRMCLRHWGKNRTRATYFEQGFLDLAPLLFENVSIYRGREHNVGPWNEADCGVKLPEHSPWEPRLVDGNRVKSFHAASPDALGIFEVKVAWDQVMCLIHGLPLSALGEEFREWLVTSQAKHWPALKRAVFLYQTVRYRLNYDVPFLSEKVLSQVTRGRVKDVVALFSQYYSRGRDSYRKLVGQPVHGVELLSSTT